MESDRGVLDKESHGDRQRIDPVGSHDIYLVDTKAQTDVEYHVECEIRQDQPEILALPAIPDA